ncbi:MAG: 30S ribosomal protein S13 [Candidatus Bathyarchaeota archaeon]|nr:MAG: 30S ribosomal protein S13 [Candidatus Bathyarchaeota archaeon]
MPREFQHIIRIADTDLDGTITVDYALTKIKGVGIRLAKVIAEKAKINPESRLGYLSDVEVSKIEDVIENPPKYDVPEWLLNRSKDSETGKALHLVGSDLIFQTKANIDQMKKMKSWKGIRHAYGLKVRGQRTRTTGRKGKAIGVKKKRVIQK